MTPPITTKYPRKLRRLASIVALSIVASLAGTHAAQAFDTGPHGDMTVDAMQAEGFGQHANDVARVNNWFVDFYSNASKVPYSDKSSIVKRLLAGAFLDREKWPQSLVDAAARNHVDSGTRVYVDGKYVSLRDPRAMAVEMQRLRYTTYKLARQAKAAHDPLLLLTAIGISTHPLQDFYSHTNWAEAVGDIDGPGWDDLNEGSVPTFFDVPPDVRAKVNLYAGGAEGTTRTHGNWADDPHETVAKDWPGRPRYAQAYITGYFATRQWLRAIRTWVDDEPLWRAAQQFDPGADGRSLSHDVTGAREVSSSTGHLYGEGGPCDPTIHGCGDAEGWGGTLVAARTAIRAFFSPSKPSRFRKRFEQVMPAYLDRLVPDELPYMPIESSRPIQAQTRFVQMQVLNMRSHGLGDPWPDDADMYARATLGGQQYVSPVIHSHDRFSFPAPYHAFTFIKAVPTGEQRAQPVEDVTVRVKTSKASGAGTDDTVYLRLGGQRFKLDKPSHDDFERRGDDTYNVPIDGATRAGLDRGDIDRVALEKSPGGDVWKLAGVVLTINGEVAYRRDGIETSLERRSPVWTAPGYVPQLKPLDWMGVWLDLKDDDLGLYGGDDQGDIHPSSDREAVSVAYPVGGVIEKATRGFGGEAAGVIYRIETIDPSLPSPVVTPQPTDTPQPDGTPRPDDTPQPDDTPPPPPGKPDLAFTALGIQSFTLTNRGDTLAGPFSVKVGTQTFRYGGIAPGRQITQGYAGGCGGSIEARVDTGQEVDEGDETNNETSATFIC
jgi:hypothetical protein